MVSIMACEAVGDSSNLLHHPIAELVQLDSTMGYEPVNKCSNHLPRSLTNSTPHNMKGNCNFGGMTAIDKVLESIQKQTKYLPTIRSISDITNGQVSDHTRPVQTVPDGSSTRRPKGGAGA